MGKVKPQIVCYAVGFLLKIAVVHIGVALTGSWIVVVLANALIIVTYCFVQKAILEKMLK